MRKSIVACAAALSLAALFAASSVGEEASSRTGALDRDFERVASHSVASPSALSSATAGASAKGKPKVKYFETDALPVPAGGAAFSLECPRKHKALSGYFLSSGGIALDASAISEASLRVWQFGLFSPSGTAGQAILGVVCGKKL